jgi:NIMA (never in mitosis gene a)-related kinase
MKANYKIVKELKGPSLPFLNTYLAKDNNEDKKYVIISFNIKTKTDDEKGDILNQLKLLKKLDHPNIIKIKEYYINKNPLEYLNIVTEFADGGCLDEKIEAQKKEPFPESQILDYFIQICLALKILQKNKIKSFILKSDNIFLTKSGIVKIGFFYLPIGINDTFGNNKIGKYYKYTTGNDIWLLGELLYQLLTFKMPFNTNFYKGKYSPPPKIYSAEIKDLLEKCLTFEPEKRPSINDILQLPIIKDRINNFLNEIQYEQNLYTIIAKKYKDNKKEQKQEKSKEIQTKETNINKEEKISDINKDEDKNKKLDNDKKKMAKFFMKKKKEKSIETNSEINQEPTEKINKTNFLSQKKDPNFIKDKIYKEDEIGKILNTKGYIDLIDEKTGNFDVNKMNEDQYNQLELLNNFYKIINNQEQDLDSD